MKRVKCFAEEAARLGGYATLDAGPRVVETRRITGTVGKCGELDGRFRLIGRSRDLSERFRRLRLEQARLHFESLPPIDVYRLAGEYYVIDGNRRVAAAKLHGLEYMDARVVECVPLGSGEAREGAVSRRRFEQETGLKSIRLNYETGYGRLLEEAREFAIGEPDFDGSELKERARKWHSTVFLPACELIRASSLPSCYPQAEPGDLFVLVSQFYKDMMGGYPRGISYASLLSGFHFARRVPARRLYRLAPFRLLLSVLRGRAKRRNE